MDRRIKLADVTDDVLDDVETILAVDPDNPTYAEEFRTKVRAADLLDEGENTPPAFPKRTLEVEVNSADKRQRRQLVELTEAAMDRYAYATAE